MTEQPLITHWSDVERWLRREASDCAKRRQLPASVAFAFHRGRVSLLVETPPFCVEHADLVTDELCRFLPQLRADQLLVIWPAAYNLEPDGAPTLWMLKAHLGDRVDGWRTLLYPLPFDDPEMTIEPVEVDANDPWSERIHHVFEMPVPRVHDTVLVTPSDDHFLVAASPDGPYAASTTLFGFN